MSRDLTGLGRRAAGCPSLGQSSPPSLSAAAHARQITPRPRMAGNRASPRLAVEGAQTAARTPTAWTRCLRRVEPAPRPTAARSPDRP